MIPTPELRQTIIQEAETWIGTPYHAGARIKGAGCDCLTFIAGVLINVKVVPENVEIPFYRTDFMKHGIEETYLNGLLQYGREIEEREVGRGDVVIYKLKGAGIFCHTGIVDRWPERIIHCFKRGVRPGHGLDHNGFGLAPRKFLTAF